jgi:preprotein translocase SecE subunit
MAVAVKNMPETTTITPSRPIDRLPVISLLGAGYVLAGIAAVFYLLPALWWDWVQMARTPVMGTLLILTMVLTAGAWAFGAVRLTRMSVPAGMKAGIFCGLLELLVIGLVTCGVGNLIAAAHWGQDQPAIGIGITVVVGVGLLAAGIWYFFHPAFKRWLVILEEQGWFDFAPYKKSQGQRVRRWTLAGIIALTGCGIYTMLAHRTLESGLETRPGHIDWQVPIPFASGHYWIILPDVPFTVPILLAGAALWIGYRIVNLPVFADFLIATEAELNKVSWSPWKKLKQDTVVVLVTVLLLTLFLFVVDQGWAWLLTRVGVVQVRDSTQDVDSQKELPW